MSVLMDIKSIEQALRFTAILNGEDPTGGTVDLPHDFSLAGSDSMDKLFEGYLASGGRAVRPELVFDEMRRHQWFAETVSAKDEAAVAREALGLDSPPEGASTNSNSDLNTGDSNG